MTTFKLENNAYRADYRIANGKVAVYNIQLIDKLQRQRDRMEQPALYRVKRNSQGVWQASGKVDKVATPTLPLMANPITSCWLCQNGIYSTKF